MRGKTLTSCVVALAVFATSLALVEDRASASPSPVPAIGLGDPELGKAYKSEIWGYGIRPLEDWNSIPAQPDEKNIVGGWRPDQEILMRKGDMSGWGASLQIVRFEVTGTTSTPEAEAREKERREKLSEYEKTVGENLRKKHDPKTVDDWIEGNFEGASKRYTPQSVKCANLTGELLEFTSGRTMLCIAVFKEAPIEWAVVYAAPEEYYESTWKKAFEKSIKSFKTFKPTQAPMRILTVEELKKLPPERRREAIKQQISGNPGWYAIDTDNYVFLSNSKNKSLIRLLARDIESIRKNVYEVLFPPQKPIDTISIVRVLSTQAEYYMYGGPQGSAGYWNAQKEELVLFDEFDDVSKKDSKAFTRSVMYHEAFHQYIHFSVGELAPHSWFNEGHGDYFAGARVSGNRVRMDEFEWRVDYLKQHLRDDKGLIPIQSLVRLPQGEYYTNAGLKYAQGWALIYFLREVTNDERWKQIPDIYFKHLSENVAAFKKKKKDEENPDDTTGGGIPGLPGITIVPWEDQQAIERILEEAVDKAFEGVDYQELDAEFARWVERSCG